MMDVEDILKVHAHRPYPLQKGPWVMQQTWHDLLFAHWPVDADHVRAAMPPALRAHLDLRDGSAWVGVIPFWMSGVKMRGMPPVPTASTFPELNVRTYVTVEGKPGVYFFSLDAASRLAVLGAKIGFGLNYFQAKMAARVNRNQVQYESKRLDKPRPAEFVGSYAPENSKIFNAEPGTLEHFVTERYCLYTSHGPHIGRANIHHLPWPLQRAKATIKTNTMASAAGIELPRQKPHLMFAKELNVLVWPLETVS
jgi:uncharacterized protein YqjF (DUF2071 family)